MASTGFDTIASAPASAQVARQSGPRTRFILPVAIYAFAYGMPATFNAGAVASFSPFRSSCAGVGGHPWPSACALHGSGHRMRLHNHTLHHPSSRHHAVSLPTRKPQPLPLHFLTTASINANISLSSFSQASQLPSRGPTRDTESLRLAICGLAHRGVYPRGNRQSAVNTIERGGGHSSREF